MRNVGPVEQPKRKRKPPPRTPAQDETWQQLIAEGLLLRKDLETFVGAGCNRDALLALARGVVAREVLAAIPSTWRHLFGVKPRVLSSLPVKLDDVALTVERLNDSVFLSIPRLMSRHAQKTGSAQTDLQVRASSLFRDLPAGLRAYARAVRDLTEPALQSTPKRRFKRERDAVLSDLLLNAAGSPETTTLATAEPPFEVVARLLNATRDVLARELKVRTTTAKRRPYTGDSLRRFWNRLTLRKALGLPPHGRLGPI